MRVFLTLLLALLVAAPAEARRPASALLVDCDRAEKSALFRGEMAPVKKGPRMEMRFTLQARERGEAWERVKGVPGFGSWESADWGRAGYIVDREVSELVGGTSYRSVVRFRWRDQEGNVVARARRTTRGCRQPDHRANLVPVKIDSRPAATADTLVYAVHIANDGRADADPFSVELVVNGGEPASARTIAPLEAGEEVVVEIEAPRCMAGSMVTATVDVDDEVDETDVADNTLSVPCPAGRSSS